MSYFNINSYKFTLLIETNQSLNYSNYNMDEDNLNIEIRKFLKKVGITSQREIESHIRKKFSEGDLKEGDSIEVSMKLSSEDGKALNTIKEKINIK